MHPDRSGRRGERLHSLREQAEHHPGEDIAAAGRRQLRRRVGVDRDPAVRRGDHGIGALQQDDRAALPRRAARPLGLAAGSVEQPGKLAGMRRHDARRADRLEQCLRVFRKGGQRVGIEHRALSRAENRQGLVAGFAADPCAGADQRRIAPGVREKGAELVEIRRPGATMTPVSAAA